MAALCSASALNTPLGRTICALERQERVALVAEALGAKACSTLKKRLSSLKGLVVWWTVCLSD